MPDTPTPPPARATIGESAEAALRVELTAAYNAGHHRRTFDYQGRARELVATLSSAVPAGPAGEGGELAARIESALRHVGLVDVDVVRDTLDESMDVADVARSMATLLAAPTSSPRVPVTAEAAGEGTERGVDPDDVLVATGEQRNRWANDLRAVGVATTSGAIRKRVDRIADEIDRLPLATSPPASLAGSTTPGAGEVDDLPPALVDGDLPSWLRAAAAGRREYAEKAPKDQADILNVEAATLDNAAKLASGDISPMWGWLPSWRWGELWSAEPPAQDVDLNRHGLPVYAGEGWVVQADPDGNVEVSIADDAHPGNGGVTYEFEPDIVAAIAAAGRARVSSPGAAAPAQDGELTGTADPTGAVARMRVRIDVAVERAWAVEDDEEPGLRSGIVDAVMSEVGPLMQRQAESELESVRQLTRARALACRVDTPAEGGELAAQPLCAARDCRHSRAQHNSAGGGCMGTLPGQPSMACHCIAFATPTPAPAPPGVDSEAGELTRWLDGQIGERERKATRSSTEMARAHEEVAAFARDVRDRLTTPTTGETR